MRVALSGVGLRAVTVLNFMRDVDPDLAVVGYYDPEPAHLDKLEPGIPGFASVAEMIDRTAPDLFYVASPNHAHLEQIRTGLESGVRVFSEKPVVISMEQTWALVRLLADHGPDSVLVGMVIRFSDHLKDIKDAMADNRLGKIVSIEANEHICPGHGAYFMRDWRRHSAQSGGFMLEKCCHDLDFYMEIAGARPLRVASFGGRDMFTPGNAPDDLASILDYSKTPTGNAPTDPYTSDGDIIDHQAALMEFENRVSMTFHTTLNAPNEQRRFCIFGTEGMAEGDFHGGYLRFTSRNNTYPEWEKAYTIRGSDPGHYGADFRMAAAIMAHFKDVDRELPVSVTDAIEAGIVALALDESRLHGGIVNLGETWERLDRICGRKPVS
ncbi:MAG: Gfo/Idh/MocA family oxidoreductase [Rhodobacteraceae bacterium]|nr:Gfo/Idh/MocA family oxidoreductase [Paracoccaceae bacterium]